MNSFSIFINFLGCVQPDMESSYSAFLCSANCSYMKYRTASRYTHALLHLFEKQNYKFTLILFKMRKAISLSEEDIPCATNSRQLVEQCKLIPPNNLYIHCNSRLDSEL